MSNFSNAIINQFKENANPINAIAQAQYMKNKFVFFGLTAPKRRELQKPFLIQKYLPSKSELDVLVKELWTQPQRELHYFTQELVRKYIKQLELRDIDLFEFMIVNNSWWDSVDFIAPNLVGAYFEKFPNQRDVFIKKWLQSNNIWLQRSAILFQLKYKQQLDTVLLATIINKLLGSKEFFINKAIGWILREYGKTNPNWVLDFVSKTELSNLSKREAIRLIK
ncbi:MAG: DNA alkylation repair protein [Flavobacteriaceae bacterium]